jgi:hypothetical protein
MKLLLVIGIVLLLGGGALLAFGYVTHRDTDPVVEIGKLEITKTRTERKRIPPVVSGTIMGVGAVLTIAGALKRK